MFARFLAASILVSARAARIYFFTVPVLAACSRIRWLSARKRPVTSEP
jgi:hypothetical protein